jgi:hypothetical protein
VIENEPPVEPIVLSAPLQPPASTIVQPGTRSRKSIMIARHAPAPSVQSPTYLQDSQDVWKSPLMQGETAESSHFQARKNTVI